MVLVCQGIKVGLLPVRRGRKFAGVLYLSLCMEF